jgi:integrase
MKIDYIKVVHPTIKDRKITLIFIDNKLDLVSAKFLMYEARHGGRHGFIPGRESHKLRANRIGELYRHLHALGKCWRTATEIDIKKIRNAMLCWTSNNIESLEKYDYEPISNDSMNAKLSYWFKFYMYMKKVGEFHELKISIIKVRKKNYSSGLLSHLNYRENQDNKFIDVWLLKVKPSPIQFSYHAISKLEYIHLEERLKSIDIVYALIAYLMVETGLRAAAALEVKEVDFKNLFKYLNSGKKKDDVIKLEYISKGGNLDLCDIPLRAIERIQKEYLSREFVKRRKLYTDRCFRLGKKYNEKNIWFTDKGKEVNYIDLRLAFKKASEEMGRYKNKITAHWMRHTFATWTLIDYSDKNNIPLNSTGVSIDIRLKNILMRKLGHASESSTMKYIITAIELSNTGTHNGTIIPLKSFLESKIVQNITREKAIEEFDEEFDEELFDVVKYAISRGIVVDDSYV